MFRIAAVIVSQVILAQASPALTEYEATMKPASANLALAHAANMCRIRSDDWLAAFDLGYQGLASSEAKRLHLSSAELTAADQANQKTYADTISTTACRDLPNSSTMEKLDRIHDHMTGGYK